MTLMASKILKRSLSLRGRKSSISLEDEFWGALQQLADERRMRVSALVRDIDAQRDGNSNLSSTIRVHILTQFRERCAAPLPQDEAHGLNGNHREQ